MLRLLLLAVKQLAAGLAVHAQVDPLLVRHPVLRRRGDVIAEAALELLHIVDGLDVLLERGPALKDQAAVLALAFEHLLAGTFDVLATQCCVVEDFITVGTRPALPIKKHIN
jgi:hypothetical protein